MIYGVGLGLLPTSYRSGDWKYVNHVARSNSLLYDKLLVIALWSIAQMNHIEILVLSPRMAIKVLSSSVYSKGGKIREKKTRTS